MQKLLFKLLKPLVEALVAELLAEAVERIKEELFNKKPQTNENTGTTGKGG